jgi:hypothetical protein
LRYLAGNVEELFAGLHFKIPTLNYTVYALHTKEKDAKGKTENKLKR